jgi:hypothetical protein
MTATIDHVPSSSPPPAPEPSEARVPLLTLLHPREHMELVVVTGSIALGAAVVSRGIFGWPLWKAVALVLAVMVVPASRVWRATAQRYGLTAAMAGALVTVQGLHSIEHGWQYVQRHVLHLSLRESNGLLSPANSEWVHFVWNWLVLSAVVVLFARGMRNVWAVALLVWATAHTLEHTYMWWRFLEVSAELNRLGQGNITAQGLPGIVGRGGWLDLNGGPRLDLICGMPFVTNTDRLEAHFVWNTGEVLLLLPAVHVLLRRRRGDATPTP